MQQDGIFACSRSYGNECVLSLATFQICMGRFSKNSEAKKIILKLEGKV